LNLTEEFVYIYSLIASLIIFDGLDL